MSANEFGVVFQEVHMRLWISQNRAHALRPGEVYGPQTPVVAELRIRARREEERQEALVVKDDRPTHRSGAVVGDKSQQSVRLTPTTAVVGPENQLNTPGNALRLADLIHVCPALQQQLC